MNFWQHLLSKLKTGNHVYLLTVIQSSGSSPGRQGFKMMVSDDDFIYGSIGGGVMEYEMVKEAKNLLKKNTVSVYSKKQIHKGNVKDSSGMICSGEQTIVFYPLNKVNTILVQKIVDFELNNKKIVLSISLKSMVLLDELINSKYQVEINSSRNWNFKELIGLKETLYIIGGGHVGLAVSELIKKIGFYVIVIDNRENLNTLETNSFAHQKFVIDYSEITKYVHQGIDSYVAIMTNKYSDDILVLRKLINNNHKYIGVLGSKQKLKTMFEVLQKEEFSKTNLSKICAPIGLDIKSETPYEIAVSIVAQIIKRKNS